MSAIRALGVDGCRGGWVVASRAGAAVVASLEGVVADATFTVIGVDMPIGLPERWGRSADEQARRVLGWPRSSSVFSTPPRGLVHETDYQRANGRSWTELGQGLPRQTFHLFARIREVDHVAGTQPADRLIEVHPECSFELLAGCALPSKHT